MKKVNFKRSKLSQALAGKGFYVALSLSLVAIGVAAAIAYDRTIDNLTDDPLAQVSDTSTSSNEWGYSDDSQNVNKPQPGISKESTTTTTATTTTTTQTTAKPVNLPVRNNNLRVMPIIGEIVNGYSGGELVKSKTLGSWKTHDGVDIAGNIGDHVKAITDGTVTSIKEDALWGICIVIAHDDGVESHYCNLGAGVTVKVDQDVEAGDVIGVIGDSAEIEIAEVPHLHFAIKQNGKWIDPIVFIGPVS